MGCSLSQQDSSSRIGSRRPVVSDIKSTGTESSKSERRVQFNDEVSVVRSPANVSAVKFSLPFTPTQNEVEDVRKPYPPQRKRRDLIPDVRVFKKIDENALKVSSWIKAKTKPKNYIIKDWSCLDCVHWSKIVFWNA